MLIDGLPYLGPTFSYKFLSNCLLPLLAESPTNTLKEISSCKVVMSRVRLVCVSVWVGTLVRQGYV